MKTKLLLPAVAIALGCASWSAGATASYPESSATSTPPVNTIEMNATRIRSSGTETAMYVDKAAGEFTPNRAVRVTPPERAARIGVAPARMFQLRDNAGG